MDIKVILNMSVINSYFILRKNLLNVDRLAGLLKERGSKIKVYPVFYSSEFNCNTDANTLDNVLDLNFSDIEVALNFEVSIFPFSSIKETRLIVLSSDSSDNYSKINAYGFEEIKKILLHIFDADKIVVDLDENIQPEEILVSF